LEQSEWKNEVWILDLKKTCANLCLKGLAKKEVLSMMSTSESSENEQALEVREEEEEEEGELLLELLLASAMNDL
jgi:hypothetical protein